MTKSIQEFLATPQVKEMKSHSLGDMMSEDFFRDPLRSVMVDPSILLAPADGVVLYALPEVKPNDFLEIKGKDFSLREMLHDPDYDEVSLVVGIFMTSYSVHINRVPASAYFIDERYTNFIYTHNISMLLAENDLLNDFGYKDSDLRYLTSNERRVSVFYSSDIGGRFYIVQVGDRDIDVIQTWGKNNHLIQGERMGMIRWGSQCDLVIPLRSTKFEILVKKLDYVEAGLDPIIQIVGGGHRSITIPPDESEEPGDMGDERDMGDDGDEGDDFSEAFDNAAKGE
jgi:phosphatidylserine decarboxylase